MAIRALNGVLANVDHEGQLQNTSFGTAVGRDLDLYAKTFITPMPYGSSLAMCALGEWLRTYL